MAVDYASLKEEDMQMDEGLGHPRAYAKLSRHCSVGIYSHGPPFTYTPYALQQDEILRVRELDQMFPIVDPKAKPTAKPRIFVSLLWKQLNHLGNAGFDPAVIRIDPYGNVLYFHADKGSPLAWDIDHWFPCSRGGLTVPSNLRILQWQVCKRKHNKLEYLVPWWDLQLGISVNQFLSMFASSNSDFRRRAFSFLFLEGENEELNDTQNVESHSFPRHFIESKDELGLAPAAVVMTRKESSDSSLALRALDYNRQMRSHSPAIGTRRFKASALKENENPDLVTNPYQAIVVARDSLKQREEAQKLQTEIQKLDDEVDEMKRKDEEEKRAIENLELALTKRRRRAEKCRRLAEAQSSYRTMLEKMIRDAMHQSVVYKEQVRLNQAAANALMARLEAQKAICDASEKELHKRFKQRDEIEKQIRPDVEQGRKRSRTDNTLSEEETDNKPVLCLPGTRPSTPLHKELRVFLEEEHRASEAGLSGNEDRKQNEIGDQLVREEPNNYNKSIVVMESESAIEHKFQALEIGGEWMKHKTRFPEAREQEIEEDEESRQQRGKGNVERWLQMLLENSSEEKEQENIGGRTINGYQNFNVHDETSMTEDIITKLNKKFPLKEAKSSRQPGPEIIKEGGADEVQEEKQLETIEPQDKGKRVQEIVEKEEEEENKPATAKANNTTEVVRDGEGTGSSKSFESKEKVLARSESARTLRRIPSSPSIILGSMRKGVQCVMRKKTMVTSDDDGDEYHHGRNSFIKSSIKTVKKTVKI